MSFISFNLKYYKEKISRYENKKLDQSDITEIKVLIRMVDDLCDEGYFDLYNILEEDKIITRLKKLLTSNNEKPYENITYSLNDYSGEYKNVSLDELISKLEVNAKQLKKKTDNSIVFDILEFSKWIQVDHDTSYIFLLRDALLPYIFFKNHYHVKAYPYIIGRAFCKDITGVAIDDDIRAIIIEALDSADDYDSFINYCRPKILDLLARFNTLKETLLEMLGQILVKKLSL